MAKLVLDKVVWDSYDVLSDCRTGFFMALLLTLNLTWSRTSPEQLVSKFGDSSKNILRSDHLHKRCNSPTPNQKKNTTKHTEIQKN